MSRRGDAVRTVLRGSGQALITLGIVVLLFCVYELRITNLVTEREQGRLGDELRRSWAAPPPEGTTPAEAPPERTTPAETPLPSPSALRSTPAAPSTPPAPSAAPAPIVARPVEPGQPVAVLHIPRLGDWNDEPPVVVEGVSTGDLKKGPGHMPGTAMPGQLGNVVLSGHRTTYGAPFARVDELRPGDAVVIETRDTWYTYTVRGSRIVAPTAVEVTWPVPGDASAAPTKHLLTLTTCHPEYSARQRLVVTAELTSTEAKSAGRPTALRAA